MLYISENLLNFFYHCGLNIEQKTDLFYVNQNQILALSQVLFGCFRSDLD